MFQPSLLPPDEDEPVEMFDEWLERTTDRTTETITCLACDAVVVGIAEAEAAGWLNVIRYDDGPTWNYLGVCPWCVVMGDGFGELGYGPWEESK